MPSNKSNIPSCIIIAGTMITIAIIFRWTPAKVVPNAQDQALSAAQRKISNEETAPSSGTVLPVVWGTFGQKLQLAGVIKAGAFEALYSSRGALTEEEKRLLSGTTTGQLVITPQNAGYLLNLLWALGLSQKNPILESGEMSDPRYGGKQSFASTGGWTLAEGNPVDHYSYHTFFVLTAEQQALVDRVSRNIYRPCCGNSTHFPDCNHGMAMLGLLELMASQGAGEQDMYKAALVVNSYWFPDQYAAIARYMHGKGIDWNVVDPKTVLGADFSSAQGFAKIAAQATQPIRRQSGGGCQA